MRLSHEFRNLQKRSINLKTRKNQGVHILSGYPCIKDIYKTFLQVSSLRYSGLALSEVSPSPLSHDTVSRWLKSRCFRPKDLWRLVEPSIDKKSPCVLIADDTLIAKTRSKKIEMLHYQYSGNEHDVIAGIGLVNLLWHDLTKVESIPINYRIYDKDSDGKTKNTHFSEMLTLAKKRGIMPEAVVMDAWYSSLDNLKSIRSHGWIWVTTLRKNGIVNHNKQLNKLDISEEGTSIHLRGYGWVTVFKFTAKNGRIDYIHEFRNLQKRSINLKTRKNQGVHILSGYPCIKDIYKTFLQVSSLRYSGLALSEVSPSPLSHDTVSQWLKSRCFRPKDLWRLVEPSIDKKSPCVLIADDTLIAKTRSKKIEMLHYCHRSCKTDPLTII